MKKNSIIRSLLAIVVMLALAVSMTACGSSSPNVEDVTEAPKAEAEQFVVYSFGPMTGGAAWSAFEDGFYDACEELGWEGHYLAPTTDNDWAAVINLHETAITNGANALMTLALDPSAYADILDRAQEEGIYLVGVYNDDPHNAGYIGTNPIGLGEAEAVALCELMEGKDIYCVSMQTDLSNQSQIDQVDAFEAKLKELRPDATLVSREGCNSSAQTAQDRLSALCTAHPEINSLVSFDSYAGLGAAAYVAAEGLEDSFTVVGIDAAKEIFLCIQDGSMKATVAQAWYTMGYEGVKLVEKVKNGEEIPWYTDPGTPIVYAENLEQMIDELHVDMS